MNYLCAHLGLETGEMARTVQVYTVICKNVFKVEQKRTANTTLHKRFALTVSNFYLAVLKNLSLSSKLRGSFARQDALE